VDRFPSHRTATGPISFPRVVGDRRRCHDIFPGAVGCRFEIVKKPVRMTSHPSGFAARFVTAIIVAERAIVGDIGERRRPGSFVPGGVLPIRCRTASSPRNLLGSVSITRRRARRNARAGRMRLPAPALNACSACQLAESLLVGFGPWSSGGVAANVDSGTANARSARLIIFRSSLRWNEFGAFSRVTPRATHRECPPAYRVMCGRAFNGCDAARIIVEQGARLPLRSDWRAWQNARAGKGGRTVRPA
jgi:hypothetical protein